MESSMWSSPPAGGRIRRRLPAACISGSRCRNEGLAPFPTPCRESILFLTFLSQSCIGLRERQHFFGRQVGRECYVEEADHHLIETLLPPDHGFRRVWILRIIL